MHAAWLVRRVCSKHVQETPKDESGPDEIARANRSCAALTATIEERVNPIFMREVIRLFEELHEVHTGRHPDIDRNESLTVNNVPDLIDGLQRDISKAVAALLAHTEPMSRAGEKVPA